jgi:hypothetical protein
MLALGQCSPTDAAKTIDDVLVGLRTADVLQRPAERVLCRCRSANHFVGKARVMLDRQRDASPHAAAPAGAIPSRAKLDKCQSLLVYVDRVLASAGKRLTRLRVASRVIGVMTPPARTDAHAVYAQVEAALAHVTSERDALAADLARAVSDADSGGVAPGS